MSSSSQSNFHAIQYAVAFVVECTFPANALTMVYFYIFFEISTTVSHFFEGSLSTSRASCNVKYMQSIV